MVNSGNTKVMVSGCFDILHGGHVEFFRQAKSLGDHLTVCVASDDVLMSYKGKKSSLPMLHKVRLIESIDCVDKVITSSDLDNVLDFATYARQNKPDIVAVTTDDMNADAKETFCDEIGASLVVLPKSIDIASISTSELISKLKAPVSVPLRVDLAGGWLDVPRYAVDNAFIVNCAIDIFASIKEWPVEKRSGLGGSAAWAILNGKNPVDSELNLGVGWQDPAVIQETGLCVWRSGPMPVLECKCNPDWLEHLALYYTGIDHDTPHIANNKRDYKLIEEAGLTAMKAVVRRDLAGLHKAVRQSYNAQLVEGMKTLPEYGEAAKKYCGGGWGGYALYMFKKTDEIPDEMIKIKGYMMA